MTDEQFQTWLGRPALESDADVVEIGLGSHPDDEWLTVTNWIFSRILAIGGAYRLHYLGVVARATEEEVFNSTQCVCR